MRQELCCTRVHACACTMSCAWVGTCSPAGGQQRRVLQVFNFVVGKGINLFDTADSYGTGRLNGQSEKLLGRFTAQLPQRQQERMAIATKIAPYPWAPHGRPVRQRLQVGTGCAARMPAAA